MKGVLERAWPLVALAAIVAAFYHGLLDGSHTWFTTSDHSDLVLPWFQLQAREWHDGRFPLWDAANWAGQPLFGQAQPGAAYPLNWLLFLMPLDDGRISMAALNAYYVLVRVLAACTAFLLCRGAGLDRWASVFGGAVYALGGYLASTGNPQMFNGAVWVPLVFLHLWKAAQPGAARRHAALSGFFLGVMWLCGHHQIQLFTTLAAAAFWIALSLRQRRAWRLAALSMTIAGLVSAFQTLPAAEYATRTVRWVEAPQPVGFADKVPYNVHAKYSMKGRELFAAFVPGIGDGMTDPYTGALAVLLAVAAVWKRWADGAVRGAAALAAGAIFFALGHTSLLHGVFYALVPMVEKARVPGAANVLLQCALAVLAAAGLQTIARPAASRRPLIPGLVLVAALSVFLAEAARGGPSQLPPAPEAGRPAEPRAERLRLMSAFPQTLAFLRMAPEGRVFIDPESIPYGIGNWDGIDTLNAPTAAIPANVWNHLVFSLPVQQFFGVRYYAGRKPMFPEQREVFAGDGGIRVFENPAPFPRVWVVHQARTASSRAAIRDLLISPAFDARATLATLSPAPPVEDCAGSAARIRSRRAGEVVIEARLACRGVVILSDSDYPGWHVDVDGAGAPIIPAFDAIRGVAAPPGVHVIRFRYSPASVWVGAALSILGMLLTGWLIRPGAPDVSAPRAV